MTPKEFKKTYWPDIAASCEETGLNPLFVAAVVEYMERAGRQAGNPRGPARDEQAPGPEFMPNPDIYDEE